MKNFEVFHYIQRAIWLQIMPTVTLMRQFTLKIVLSSTNPVCKFKGYLGAVSHIYSFLSKFITSLRRNPIIVPVILHGKLCRALLA